LVYIIDGLANDIFKPLEEHRSYFHNTAGFNAGQNFSTVNVLKIHYLVDVKVLNLRDRFFVVDLKVQVGVHITFFRYLSGKLVGVVG